MKIFNTMKKTNKETSKLPMNGKVKRGFRFYCAIVAALTLVMGKKSRKIQIRTLDIVRPNGYTIYSTQREVSYV